MKNLCDKCELPVLPYEDATIFDALLYNLPAMIMSRPRHILCSPSRAQYILDLNVVETRPEYDKRLKDPIYVQENEKLYTEIYHELQKKYKK